MVSSYADQDMQWLQSLPIDLGFDDQGNINLTCKNAFLLSPQYWMDQSDAKAWEEHDPELNRLMVRMA